MNLSQANILIIGLGVTGQSCARYLKTKGYHFSLYDENMPSTQRQIVAETFDCNSYSGQLTEALLADFDVLVLSPGIPLNQPIFKQAIAQGKTITSDIELFVNESKAKLIGITGSNGKTTVTTWVQQVFSQLGLHVAMGGNIGTPVLDLLNENYDVVVLELSSFQLDLYKNIPLEIAVILNISPDHLDRYESYQAYQQSKLSICDNAKVNLVDQATSRLLNAKHYVFAQNQGDFVYKQNKNDWQLCSEHFDFAYDNTVFNNAIERINALVVLSIAALFKITPSSVDPLLKKLSGLAHRNQTIATINGVNYVNDSKGTNIGASISAIQSQNTPVILIAGGLAKGANFSEMESVIKQHCKAVVLIGQDAALIAKVLNKQQCYFENTLENAVKQATNLAQAGDTVLLSPACASFDMFKSYQDRGNQFIHCVENLQAGIAC